MRPLFPTLALLCLGACGADDRAPGPGSLHHLQPLPAEGGLPSNQPVLLTRLEAPEDPADWAAQVNGEASPRYQKERLILPTAGGCSLRIPGPIPAGFNRVVIQGVFQGTKQRFDLNLITESGRKLPLQAQIALPMGVSQSIVFDAPHLPRSRPFQELSIEISGGPSGIEHVDFWKRPSSAHYPSLGDPAGTITILEESRMGWGLPSGIQASCPLGTIRPGSRLIASAGIVRSASPRSKKPKLIVVLSGETIGNRRHILDLARKDQPFQDLDVDLSSYAGKEVTATFELELDEDEQSACALTNVAVVDPGQEPPLTLLITSDTHRGDHLGCANLGIEITTPRLDALGAQGVVFESSYSSTNITSPSHAAILTGVHPRDGRVLTNTQRMMEEAWTLGEAYRSAGWWTIAVVTVRHLGPEGTHITQGFDKVWAPRTPPPRAEIPVDQVRTWLKEAAGRPVFIWLHVFDAHDPYAPPEKFANQYWDPSLDPFDPSLPRHDWEKGTYPPRLIDLRRTDWPAALYRGEISYLDTELGRLLDHPRVQAGLVAFTADHGEELDGILSRFDHRSLTPSTLHVPLLLAGPQVPANTRVDLAVDQLDIGRTLLDLSGLYGTDYPGRNLLRYLDKDPSATRHLHYAMSAHGFSASVTSDRWHLLLQLRAQRIPLQGVVPLWHVSLHDLDKDILCGTNLVKEEPAQAQELLGKLTRWLRKRDHDPVVTMRNTSAAEIAELSALGYSTGVESVESQKPWLPAGLTAQDILKQQQ